MEILYKTLDYFLWGVGIYVLFNFLYLAFFAISALFPAKKSKIHATTFKKIAILFPNYQDNEVILDSVDKALAHNYNGPFDVFVIADGVLPETIDKLKSQGAQVIEVFFEKSTKGKALKYTLDQLESLNYDAVVVLDVDNVMGDNCLNAINCALENGYKAIQAHRVAKNIDSNFAFLDACNEEVNNQIFRKGQANLGLSPALIGSGMAFDFSYLKKLLAQIGDTVGEDKQLDFLIANDRVKIKYLNDIYVLDEKIANAKVFTNQRTRWIASQIEFLKKYAWVGLVKLFQGNFEFFNKTIQTFLMPRMLMLLLLIVLTFQALINTLGPSLIFWITLLVGLCITLFLSIPKKYYQDRRLYKAIFQIPRAMLGMFIALLSIGKAKKSFMATPHSPTSTKDI